MNFKTITEVAKEIGVPYWTIRYAQVTGGIRLPETKLGKTSAYSKSDIDFIRNYFLVRKEARAK